MTIAICKITLATESTVYTEHQDLIIKMEADPRITFLNTFEPFSGGETPEPDSRHGTQTSHLTVPLNMLIDLEKGYCAAFLGFLNILYVNL